MPSPLRIAKALKRGLQLYRSLPVGGSAGPVRPVSHLVVTPRADGAGIQAMHRMCAQFLAEQTGSVYVHLPFADVAHRQTDALGQTLEVAQWSDHWERFLNLGQGELALAELVAARGRLTTTRDWLHNEARDLPTFALQGARTDGFELVPVSFEVLRQGEAWDSAFTPAFIERMREKFRRAPLILPTPEPEPGVTEIAVHIRRGDVWRVVSGTSAEADEGHTVRYVAESYFVETIRKLAQALGPRHERLRFAIFTDGQRENFTEFTFTDAHRAHLPGAPEKGLDDLHFHFGLDALRTIQRMSRADYLVPSKSAFSALAIVLGTSTVLYDEMIFDIGALLPLRKYLATHPRGVRQVDLFK